MKTEVHFRSTAFNCTEPRDYFINECCFGDDVAHRLIQQLRAQGVETADEPVQEDFGWYFTFHVDDTEYRFIIGFQPNDPATGDQWLGWIERKTGFLASFLGSFGRPPKQEMLPEPIHAIDTALKACPEIQGVTWHEAG